MFFSDSVTSLLEQEEIIAKEMWSILKILMSEQFDSKYEQYDHVIRAGELAIALKKLADVRSKLRGES